MDILIQDGIIKSIAKKINTKVDKIIQSDSLHVSNGWVDIGAMCWDPGHEYREDKRSLKAAAANGGYTKVYTWPNTDPIIDNKAQYQYYSNDENRGDVKLYPICSITKQSIGTELAELLDLNNSGAKLFSDGLIFKGPTKELRKALEYTKSMNAQILYAPSPFAIHPDGQIHESETSIALGLPGLPGISESITIHKATILGEYTDNTFVLHNVSSKEGLKATKSKAISAIGVSYINLCEEVTAISNFNTNHKVIPPLRGKDDQKALVKAVKNNQITYITSNHFPLENDLKDKEFGLASFGASGIETVFSALISKTDLGLDSIIEKLTHGPASVAGITLETIDKNTPANLTLFDPTLSWTYDKKNCKSKCKNNPYYDQELKGKVLGVICD